jgi:hypothetical protein
VAAKSRAVGRNFDDVKKLASRPSRVVPLCLAGELVEQIDELERELVKAPEATSLAEGSPKRVIAEAIVGLQEQMREATVEFHLRALPAREWSVFFADRPERKENESAEDWEPRIFAWQAEMVSRSSADPVMSVEQVGELVDLLHHRAWATLSTHAYLLNMGEVDVPNSEAASELTRDSEQT